MIREQRWTIKTDEPGSMEGRRSGPPSKKEGDLQDYSFHTIGLGLTGPSEDEALERMSATIVEQLFHKIKYLLETGREDLAKALILRVQRLDSSYPLPPEWVRLINKE